ncbi:MAG: 50S ribosomal protein L22 [Chlamydiales bacterium]
MKVAKAITKYVRVQPRKARLVADSIRGLLVEEANAQLAYNKMKAAPLFKKTLDSAVANAETALDLRRDQLYVLEVRVNEGSRFKRAKSKCRGGRSPVLKRTSHLIVKVGEMEEKE